jgi:hypothetical protein
LQSSKKKIIIIVAALLGGILIFLGIASRDDVTVVDTGEKETQFVEMETNSKNEEDIENVFKEEKIVTKQFNINANNGFALYIPEKYYNHITFLEETNKKSSTLKTLQVLHKDTGFNIFSINVLTKVEDTNKNENIKQIGDFYLELVVGEEPNKNIQAGLMISEIQDRSNVLFSYIDAINTEPTTVSQTTDTTKVTTPANQKPSSNNNPTQQGGSTIITTAPPPTTMQSPVEPDNEATPNTNVSAPSTTQKNNVYPDGDYGTFTVKNGMIDFPMMENAIKDAGFVITKKYVDSKGHTIWVVKDPKTNKTENFDVNESMS